jgi:Mn-containing catalase
MLCNSSGSPWSANYVNVTGDIAAEQRAKVVYEYLYRQVSDKEVRAAIDFLLNREEVHNALFREAVNYHHL